MGMDNTHRFNGVPINLSSLQSGEFNTLRRYAHEHLTTALGEVAILNQYAHEHDLFGRRDRHLVVVPDPEPIFEHDPFGDFNPNQLTLDELA